MDNSDRHFSAWTLCARSLRVAALALAGVASLGVNAAPLNATIVRTQFGIPHITAQNYESLGYGLGYVSAEDNLCVLLEDIVTVRGQRSRYFGESGSYSIPSVPVVASNVDSDFFWRFMATPARLQRLKNATSDKGQQLTAGYVAGVNRYIGELKAGSHPGRHQACASAEYLGSLSESDLYGRYYRLTVLASSSAFMNEIATAQPPALTPTAAVVTPSAALTEDGQLAAFGSSKKLGSNVLALAPHGTAPGIGNMLLGNPHFPWSGSERFYMSHLQIPGELNIEGASLLGMPAVLIGFNSRLAWSHTVSTAFRFALYQLPVNPVNPSQYFFEGKLRDLVATPITIEVKNASGQITTRSRTLYRTQYGPVVVLKASGIPVLGWDRLRLYTMADANEGNDRLLDTFLGMNRAANLTEFKQAQAMLGVPWVNTAATGPGEWAYYADMSVIPNVPDSLVKECRAPIMSTVMGLLAPGLPVLQGQRAECQFLNAGGSTPNGIFAPSQLPQLSRVDYVANSNDSYWLANPEQPLTGFPRIIGAEGTEQSLRTRLSLLQTQQRIAGTDGRPGQGFTFDTLKEVALSSRILSADLAKADVVNVTCRSFGLRDISRACATLSAWDGTANLASRGEPLWREFWGLVGSKSILWKVPFNAQDPVNTPRSIFASAGTIRSALADAQAVVEDAGFDLNAQLADVQTSGAHETPIPIFGSPGSTGAYTVADSEALTPDGYKVNYGNSFIQAVTWNGGTVRAEGFVTYSQSSDPANPHYRDFTERYSEKAWVRFPFYPGEIAADQIGAFTLSQ